MSGICSIHKGMKEGCSMCEATKEEVFGLDYNEQIAQAASEGIVCCTKCGFDGIFRATTKFQDGNRCPCCGKEFFVSDLFENRWESDKKEIEELNSIEDLNYLQHIEDNYKMDIETFERRIKIADKEEGPSRNILEKESKAFGFTIEGYKKAYISKTKKMIKICQNQIIKLKNGPEIRNTGVGGTISEE